MKTKLLFTSLFTLIAAYGFTQPNFEWVNAAGSSDNDFSEDMAIDASGDVYVVGEFRNTVDFDPGPGTSILTSAGSSDIFIQKLDSDGNLIWVRQLEGSQNNIVESIEIDSNGDLIVSGGFRGTVDFDPGVGINNLSASGSYYDTYILKLNTNGNFVWVQQIDASHHCYAIDLNLTSSDEIVLAGRWFGTADFDPGIGVNNATAVGGWDTYILKLSSNGAFIWMSQITCSDNMYTQSMAVDNSNNIVLGGYFYDDIDLDPGPGTANFTAAPFQEDMYLCKLDVNGDYVWGFSFVSSLTEMAFDIEVDQNDNYYIGGWFSSPMDFDPGPGTVLLTPASGSDAYVLKLNSSGIFQWVNQIGGSGSSEVQALDFDSQGDLIVGGSYSGTVDLDAGPGDDSYTAAGSNDLFLSKIDLSGNYQWGLTFGGTDNENIRTIRTGNNGEIYTIGNYTGTSDFDPGNGTSSSTSAGSNDYFVQKLLECVSLSLSLDQNSLPDLVGDCSVPAPSAPTASNCVSTYAGVPDVTFPISTQGTTLVTWTYDDGNGNTSTQTQNVIINDNTAPVADASNLPDLTDQCEITSLSPPTATDNCSGSITGTHNASLPITASTTVAWTYNDGNGNTSTQTQNVVINDNTAPVADMANLSDVTAECEVTSLTPPTATDNCAGSITGTPDVSFPITASGTTTITWSYDDGNGNTSTQTQDVIITPIDVSTTTTPNTNDYTISANATGYNYQWIDCGNGNAIIAGSTAQGYTPIANGSYAVILDNGTCADTSDCVVIDDLGIQKNDFGAACKVYPNPTEGDLKIDLGASYEQGSVKVYNGLGQLISETVFKNDQLIELDINSAPGMYMLEINTKQGNRARINIIKE